MKYKLFILAGLLLVALGSLSLLHLSASNPNRYQNNFNRKILYNVLDKVGETPIPGTVHDVCGFTSDTVFFSDKMPNIIWITQANTFSFDSLDLHLPVLERLSPVFYTTVIFPDVIIMAGIRREAIIKNILTDKLRSFPTNTPGFANAVSINPATSIIRSIDSSSRQAVFQKVNMLNKTFVMENNLSPKIGDAGFTYDGKLSYDPVSDRLLFVCRYCNEIICFDTALNLLYRTNSIDTFQTPNVSLKITKDGVTHARPPLTINKSSCAYGGILFVRSLIKADNQSADSFNKYTTLDLYRTSNGKYLGSIYLPMPERMGLKKFRFISHSKLMAWSENRLFIYKLNTKSLLQ